MLMFRFVRSCFSLFYFFFSRLLSHPPATFFLVHALFLSLFTLTLSHTYAFSSAAAANWSIIIGFAVLYPEIACLLFFLQIIHTAYIVYAYVFMRYSHGNNNIFGDFKINLVNTIHHMHIILCILWYRFSCLYIPSCKEEEMAFGGKKWHEHK